MQTLRILVAERVAIVAEGSIGAGFDRKLRTAFEDELVRRGITPAVDAHQDHDVSVRIETRVEGMATLIRGRAVLIIDASGKTIDEVSMDNETHADVEFPTAVARRLVDLLLQSPRVNALAQGLAAARAPVLPAGRAVATSTPHDPSPEAVAEARRRFRQGTALYNLDRFSQALAEYQAAYLAISDPAFIFNIAQCHRRTGNRTEALNYYRKYLRSAPNAPPAARAEAERWIRELERVHRQK